MIVDKYSRRIEDVRKFYVKKTEDAENVEWVWEKDELAWCVFTHNTSIDIHRVKFTGNHWLSNGGWSGSPSYQIYQYEYLDRYRDEPSHNDCYELFEDLEGVKQYCNDYLERLLDDTIKSIDETKRKIKEYTLKHDKGRPEKIKRILNETETSHTGEI